MNEYETQFPDYHDWGLWEDLAAYMDAHVLSGLADVRLLPFNNRTFALFDAG
jgi:hypothetical protein